MQITKEILSFNPTTGSVNVRYFSNEVPEGVSFNIDLPLDNGQLPSEATISEILNTYTPLAQLERLAALKTITVPEFLSSKIPTPAPEPEVQSNPEI